MFGLIMMAFGFGTTLIVPLVFGKLSRSAVAICRSMVILLGKFTMIGPVGMYGCVKLIDLIKVVIFHIWLKKERWLKNLTGMESAARG